MSIPPYNSPPGGGPFQGSGGGYEPVDYGSAGSSGYGDTMGEQTSTFRSSRRPFGGRPSEAVPLARGQYDADPTTRGGRRRGGPPPKRAWWQALLSWQGALLVFMSVFAIGVASFAVAYAMIDIPKLKDDVQKQATTMYYASGDHELQKLNSDRIPVDIKEVPQHVQRVFLAAEDKTFYDNPGFSVMGMGRAVMASLRGGNKQGGSTITQQYVKNAYLNSDQNISRKLKELIISIKLENGDKAMTKNDIFEGYLNAIYFGRRSNGLASAAKAYFNRKSVKELTINEAAFLASVINGPAYYDPQYGAAAQAKAQQRMKYIADQMVEMGWYPEARKAEISKWPTTFQDPKKSKDNTSGPTGYVQDYAKRQYEDIMTRLFGGTVDPKTGMSPAQQMMSLGGYKVYTTVEKKMLEDTIEQVKDAGFDAKSRRRIALASIVPNDGAIKSMYGGPDFASFQTNYAVEESLQGGSTYKTFTLLEWLKQGYSTRERLDASSKYFKELDPREKTDPANYGKDPSYLPPKQRRGTGWYDSHGYDGQQLQVDQATWASINPVFLQMNLKVKAAKTKEMAENLGLKPPRNIEPWPSNVLGVGDTSPLQMAAAYAAIPAKGIYVKPYIISRIVNHEGKEIYNSAANRDDRNEHRAFGADVAADAGDALKGVIDKQIGTAANAVNSVWQHGGRDIAGKTGTTDNSRTAWFTGFSMNLCTSVVMYQPNPKILKNEKLGPGENAFEPMRDGSGEDEAGGRVPAKVWGMVMQKLHRGVDIVPFPGRAGIGDNNVAPPSFTPIPGLPGLPGFPGMPGYPSSTITPGNPNFPGMPTPSSTWTFPGQPGNTHNPGLPLPTRPTRPTEPPFPTQPTFTMPGTKPPGSRPPDPSESPTGPGARPSDRQPSGSPSG